MTNNQMKNKKFVDNVNHPSHYKADGIECIEAMEAFLEPTGFQAHCRACAFKYIWRAGKKDLEIQDYRKAIWYLGAVINSLEKQDGKEANKNK